MYNKRGEKKSMKNIRRFMTALLVACIMVTSSGITALATDDATVTHTSSEEENVSVQNDDVQADEVTDTQEQSSDVEKKEAFEYVYVDEQTVNIPEEQNVVVVFADDELLLEAATLYYSSLESGDIFELEASNIVDNSVRFTKEYIDVSEAGTYQLDSITYTICGQSEPISVEFSEQDVVASYVVTTEAEEEAIEVSTEESTEEMPEVTVYSIDDEDNAVEEVAEEADDIESAVESTLILVDEEGTEEAEQSISFFSLTRTVQQQEDLVVVVCPGHDATHTGAEGNGLNEEKLTFKVAQYCVEELKQYSGVTVYLLRDSIACAYPGKDKSYCLNQRIEDAAALGADVYIDVHFNSSTSSSAYGAEIYYPNNSFSTAIHEDGKTLATEILEQLEALGLYNRGAKTRDCTDNVRDENGNLGDYYTSIAGSKDLGMTGIIIEHAFVSNESDASKLKDEAFLKKLGVADATGIANAYGLKKGSSSSSSSGNSTTTSTPKVEIADLDATVGTAKIKLSNIETGANVAVWSTVNGQDDLKWYSVSGSSGTINFDMKNHKNSTGVYNVHVYNPTSTKILCNTTFTVTGANTLTKATYSVKTANYDKVKGSFDVIVYNISSNSGVSSVKVPVWSKTDQSNIKWYDAVKQSDGTYKASVSTANHGYAVGTYTIHVYLTAGNGLQTVVGTSQVVESVSVEIGAKDTTGKQTNYLLTATNVDVLGSVKKVHFATWSVSGGQDDIIWYSGTKKSSGEWTATAAIKNHKTAGTYAVHVYATMLNGAQVFVGSTTFTVTTPTMSVKTANYNKNAGTFDVIINNMTSPSGVDSVKVPVWSTSNQSNIKWYTASKQKDGSYKTTVKLSNHGNAVGKYNVHVYLYASNELTGFAATTQTVEAPKAEVSATDINGENTSYLLTASDVEVAGSFTNVYFPVWSVANGQDDIVWYKATKNSSGTWTTTVNVTDHKTSGTYNVHVYGMKADGTMTFVGNTTFEVTKSSTTTESDYYAIMGNSSVTVAQMIAYYNQSGKTYPADVLSEGGAATIDDFCQIYYEEAEKEGVCVEVAFAQAMLETNYLHYGGIVRVEQFNFAGLGALDGNNAGNCASFEDVRTGIRAQIQHLKAYASTESLKNTCVDPRFHLVTRGVAPYVEWLGIQENPSGVGWASTEGYGSKIVSIIKKIKNM